MHAEKLLLDVTGLKTENLAKIFLLPFLKAMTLITFGCCLITSDTSNAFWTCQSFETEEQRVLLILLKKKKKSSLGF